MNAPRPLSRCGRIVAWVSTAAPALLPLWPVLPPVSAWIASLVAL